MNSNNEHSSLFLDFNILKEHRVIKNLTRSHGDYKAHIENDKGHKFFIKRGKEYDDKFYGNLFTLTDAYISRIFSYIAGKDNTVENSVIKDKKGKLFLITPLLEIQNDHIIIPQDKKPDGFTKIYYAKLLIGQSDNSYANIYYHDNEYGIRKFLGADFEDIDLEDFRYYKKTSGTYEYVLKEINSHSDWFEPFLDIKTLKKNFEAESVLDKGINKKYIDWVCNPHEHYDFIKSIAEIDIDKFKAFLAPLNSEIRTYIGKIEKMDDFDGKKYLEEPAGPYAGVSLSFKYQKEKKLLLGGIETTLISRIEHIKTKFHELSPPENPEKKVKSYPKDIRNLSPGIEWSR